MKPTMTLVIALLLYSLTSVAQSPNAISYQGIARNTSGSALNTQAISLQFSLHDGSALGAVVYRETHHTTTSSLGLFSVNIGEGTPTVGTLSSVNWGSGTKFLQVELDATGGSNYIDMGTTQMMSVPYALHAKIAETVASPPAASHIAVSPNSTITATNVQDALVEVDGRFANLIDSYIHRTEDGVTIYRPAGATRKRFGIGDLSPEAPLGVKGETGNPAVVTLSNNDNSQKVNFSVSPPEATAPGFSIDDATSGTSSSRLFIRQNNGFVGIGSVQPKEKLHIESSTPSGGTGIAIQNTATTKNRAWLTKHFENGDIPEEDGRLAFLETPVEGPLGSAPLERMTLLSGGNIGINEPLPDTKLHVSRPVSDPSSAIALNNGSGIAVFGPITKNVVVDYQGLQARQGSYSGSTTAVLETATLNIQRLGGDILIHGDDTVNNSAKTIITRDGKMGVGVLVPAEKIEVDGAIKIGNTTGDTVGTIRWTGTDFEGRTNSGWESITTPSILINTHTTANSVQYQVTGQNPKVGIGTDTPSSALHILSTESVTDSSVAQTIHTEATTTGMASDNQRVGLSVTNSGSWSSNPAAKNIGIYVSDVSGQTNKEANLAAVLNGNVVVGSIDASKAIGTNGSNVLAIQSGSAPQTAPGSGNTGGVQIYADNVSTNGTAPASVLHVMNGNGDVIQLSKQPALSTPSQADPNSGDSTTDALINNLRTRLNELETRMKALGLLSN